MIINLHHFPDQIKNFVKQKNDFGIQVEFSFENKLLETGGGLKKASDFFDDDHPFVLHNVDIISNIDLNQMLDQHLQKDCLATLAVKKRKTSRYLIFDDEQNLCGWKSIKDNKSIVSREPIGNSHELGFCGIHIISPKIFSMIDETGVFSIIQTYLRLTKEGEKITAFHADEYDWQDFGKLEQVTEKDKTLFNNS